MSLDFDKKCDILKVSDELGLVMGFAMVSKVDGEDYYDSQGDHITEKAMLEASVDFMKNSREAHTMHDGKSMGEVVFAFPLLTDVAKSLGIETSRTGLLIGMLPNADVLAKFKDGTMTGFSIGGERVKDEAVDEEEE